MFKEASSLIAVCGQPPVFHANEFFPWVGRLGESKILRPPCKDVVRYHRTENSVESCLRRTSTSAVFPEPTGPPIPTLTVLLATILNLSFRDHAF